MHAYWTKLNLEETLNKLQELQNQNKIYEIYTNLIEINSALNRDLSDQIRCISISRNNQIVTRIHKIQYSSQVNGSSKTYITWSIELELNEIFLNSQMLICNNWNMRNVCNLKQDKFKC